MKTVWTYEKTFKDLRLIQPSIVKDSVELLKDFSKGMYSLAKDFKLTLVEQQELFDKVTKGNEGLVADFINSNKDILKNISKVIGQKVTNFALTYDHHGTDGYFLTKDGKSISVELKTTGAHVIPYNKMQKRKSNTKNNLNYKSGFKYHFTDKKVYNHEDKFQDFNKELENYRQRKQVTIFAGLLDINGNKKIVDIFFMTTQQSIDLLTWYKNNRKFDGSYLCFIPSTLMESGKLENHCTHVYCDKEI